jgi:hypothetical protein
MHNHIGSSSSAGQAGDAWSALPLNTWATIPNSNYMRSNDAVVAKVIPQFDQAVLGNLYWYGIFDSWSGPAFDYSSGKLYWMGGGWHPAVPPNNFTYGVFNGVLSQDLEVAMAGTDSWDVAFQPTPITQAEIDASVAIYAQYGDPAVTRYSLSNGYLYNTDDWGAPGKTGPDGYGKPMSVHTYRGPCFAVELNAVFYVGFVNNWRINLDGTWKKIPGLDHLSGNGYGFHNYSLYDSVSHKWFVFGSEESTGYWYIWNTQTQAWEVTGYGTGLVAHYFNDMQSYTRPYTGSSLYYNMDCSGCDAVQIGRKIIFLKQSSIMPNWNMYAWSWDIDNEIIEDFPLINTWAPTRVADGATVSSLFSMAMEYSPRLHRLFIPMAGTANAGKFVTIDVNFDGNGVAVSGTCNQTPWVPTGTIPANDTNNTPREVSPYGAFRIYPRSDADYLIWANYKTADHAVMRLT